MIEALRRETPVFDGTDRTTPAAHPVDARRSQAPPEEARFRTLLHGIGKAIDRGEAIMDGAASGSYQSLDPATLIALQAGIYRYSEAVDLMSKLVDRVASGVRTVVQAGH